jgi:hypothetical protein
VQQHTTIFYEDQPVDIDRHPNWFDCFHSHYYFVVHTRTVAAAVVVVVSRNMQPQPRHWVHHQHWVAMDFHTRKAVVAVVEDIPIPMATRQQWKKV